MPPPRTARILLPRRAKRLAALLSALLVCLAPGPVQGQGTPSSGIAKALLDGRTALAIPLFDQARRHFREAARLDRSDPSPHVWLARTEFLQRSGDLDEAVRELNAALRLDATDMEARYWKGRVLQRRESGKDIETAKTLFEGIVADRPLFRDSLRRLQETHVEMGTLPAYLAEREAAARAEPGNPLNTYRWAEALRQSGELARSEALFLGLRENARDFAPGRVLYSLALVLYEQERWEDGTEAYQDAIVFMEDTSVADTLWEDIYLIANLSEAQRYRQSETVEEKREFLRGFWRFRDTDRTTTENERIGVHYQRLRDAWKYYPQVGVRRAWNDPDSQGLLRLPPTYDVESPFNDMGIIYLRHGDPDDRATLIDDRYPDNMSWKYEAKGGRPELIIHFEQHALGGGWRLVAYPGTGEYAISRHSLDARFGALEHGGDLQVIARMAEIGNTYARQALTTDSYVPVELAEATALSLWSDVGYYKGAGGRTRVELYWQYPIGELINQQVAETQRTEVRVSINVFSKDLTKEVYRNQRTDVLQIPSGTPPNAFRFDQEVMALPPGIYQVTLKVEDLVGNRLQIQNIPDLEVWEFAEGDLSISTIQIARQIMPSEEGGGRFVKPGHTVIPLPSRTYIQGDDVHIYFGIYGLSKDEYNATRYQISYTLDPIGGQAGTLGNIRIGGLLGRRSDRGGIIVTQPEESGILTEVHKVLDIALERSSYRRYSLSITIQDLVAGTREVRATYFNIAPRP